MKKILVVLLVLCVAGGLFAQDAGTFTWSGFAQAGVTLNLDTDTDGANQKRDDFVIPGDQTRGEATLTYKKESATLQIGGTFGIDTALKPYSNVGIYWGDGYGAELPYRGAFKVKSTVGEPIFNLDTIANAYGYYYVLDRQLYLEGGFKGLDSGRWTTPVFEANYDNLSEKGGFKIAYEPAVISGLSLGTRIGADFSTYTADTPVRAGDYIRDTSLGIKYAPDVIPLTAVFIAKFPKNAESIAAGAKFYVLPDILYVAADFKAANFGVFSKTGTFDIAGRVAYAKAPLVLAQLTVKALGLQYDSWDLGFKSPIAPTEANGDPKLDANGDPIPAYTDAYTIAGKDGETARLEITPSLGYQIVDQILQARLEAVLALGIGDAVKDLSTLSITPGVFVNIKGDANTNEPATGIWVSYNVKTALNLPSSFPDSAAEVLKPYSHTLNLTYKYTF
jgi:hypothetical protein